MIYRLSAPATIEDGDAVRVLEWHRAPGEAILPGELLVELETQKALIEVRAERAAVLRTVAFGEGEWCPLGEALALLADDAEEPVDVGLAGEWAAEFQIG